MIRDSRALRSAPAVLVAAALVIGLLASPAHAATGATPVATGLSVPAAFTFLPDGRIFYGERFSGEIRLRDPARGTDDLVFTISDVAGDAEQGLLGLALDPAYPSAPHLLAYVTRRVDGTTVNQILRIRMTQRHIGYRWGVIYQAPATQVHNGGRIMFGPDGNLYVITGDAQNPANSQNLGNTFGKILRMTPTGGVPAGNPFPGSLIWAYGIRNSYGFNFDPATQTLWETENGPACNDELNRITAGGNYGWGPTQTCSSPPAAPLNTNRDGPSPVQPLRFYTPTTAPTGVAFCSGCGVPDLEGRMVYGTFNTRQLRAVTLDAPRTGVVGETPVYTHSTGILSVERAPDGRLYFSDGSGIYRLTAG
jgi:glucose/arabinose dehydrogenase